MLNYLVIHEIMFIKQDYDTSLCLLNKIKLKFHLYKLESGKQLYTHYIFWAIIVEK